MDLNIKNIISVGSNLNTQMVNYDRISNSKIGYKISQEICKVIWHACFYNTDMMPLATGYVTSRVAYGRAIFCEQHPFGTTNVILKN